MFEDVMSPLLHTEEEVSVIDLCVKGAVQRRSRSEKSNEERS